MQIRIPVSRPDKYRDMDPSLIPLARQIDQASETIRCLAVGRSEIIPSQFLLIGRNPLHLIQANDSRKRLKVIPDLFCIRAVQRNTRMVRGRLRFAFFLGTI
mgnify:FL=1